MAKVILSSGPAPQGLKYSDVKAGQYLVDSDGIVYAVVYNAADPSRPVLVNLRDPSDTWIGGFPTLLNSYRVLGVNEAFTVTI